MMGVDARRTCAMFNRIARHYDFANRVLSCGVDLWWRRCMVRELPPGDALDVLDLASGTGDVALAVSRNRPGARVVGCDIALEMLRIGRKKCRRTMVRFCGGDATRLPFPAASFDCVTMAFGLRNIPDRVGCLAEIRRVLRPGGRLLVLEFSLPRSRVIRWLYLAYFRRILPWLGGMISGERSAYQYLISSVQAFPSVGAVTETMEKGGFQTATRQLTAGIATLYVGSASQPRS